VKPAWKQVKLGEICEISSSKRVHERDWKSSGVPFYRAREIVKLSRTGSVNNELFISEELFEEFRSKYGAPSPGDIMVSAVGTLGACYIVKQSDRFYYKDASVLRFRPKDGICPRFILHAFQTRVVLDQVHASSGSTVGTYTISRANKTKLALPPLAEQRRIAEVLDKAEALRAKRRAALAQLDSLTQSLFLDLFGEPVANRKCWPLRSFDETMRDETSRSKKLNQSEFSEVGKFPVIDQGQSTVAGYCDDDSMLCVSPLPVVVFGDHTKAVKFVSHPFIIGADGAKVLVPESGIETVFLAALLRMLPIPDLGYSRHMREVKRLKYIAPPLDLQREFARRVAAVEKLKTAQRAALAELDALFASLQHRAFRGEL